MAKRGPFQARNDGRFIKRGRAFERLAPSCSPPPQPCVWPIVMGRWQQPPRQALCHCKSPHRLKQTHSEKKSTPILHSNSALFWYCLVREKNNCLAVTKHREDTEMGVTCREEGIKLG